MTNTPKEEAEALIEKYGHYSYAYAGGCLDARKDMFIAGTRDKKMKDSILFWNQVKQHLSK